jgi:energy-coupling factor transport system ATP-binding protein
MIEFSEVNFQHPNGVKALRDINLQIRTGEITALVGENGAGKTTLIKHANGLLKPTSGRVTVFGVDTRKESVAHFSRKIGLVFQNPNHQLFSESVEKEITFALKNFGLEEDVVEKRLNWALNFFGLERYRSTSPMLLSGGEKKRLCLAFVLAWDPDIVILDEPTVGQDFVQKEKLMHTIRMLVAQGKTVIIVSHDIEFIWPLQPRTIVMAGGRVLEDGSAAEIFSNEDLMKKARLLKPQLLNLSGLLGIDNGAFSDVHEARRSLIHHLNRGL